MRKYRKVEHIENYLKTSFVGSNLLDDVFLYNNSLPEIDFYEIDTSTDFIGKKINFPLMINAMTGGTDFSADINRDLARVAREFHLPMAVGSQTIIFEDSESIESFKVARDIIGEDGIVIANINGHTRLEDAQKAIDVIDADAIQVHLNPAQELAQEEGDRSFKNILSNIRVLLDGLDKPLIVKEVGFGISKDVAKRLYDIGVRNIDISGHGGTNFFEVENLRSPNQDLAELYSWGIPTALALIEAKSLKKDDMKLIASGGIRNSTELIKSIVLGADMVGISGEILTYLIHGGYEYTMQYISNLIYKSKMLMMLTGSSTIKDLQKTPYKLTGKLREFIMQ